MRYRFWILICSLSVLGLGLFVAWRLQTTRIQAPLLQAPVASDQPLSQIAREMTVRILSEDGAGSGVIVHRQGTLYTVLTCDHVLSFSQTDQYQVLTYRDLSYTAHRLSLPQPGDLDIGVVQFDSADPYPTALLAAPPPVGSPIVAAGFPNWHLLGSQAIEDTRDWGTRSFRLIPGEVAMYPDRSLPRGYRLGYTSPVEQGMSGGPILTLQGQVVGLNGRLMFPPQGIEVFTFADGSHPSFSLYNQMQALSWGIPVTELSSLSSPLLQSITEFE